MSSVLTGNHPTTNPTFVWAAAVFMLQTVLIGAPVVLHVGKIEARLVTVEKNVSTLEKNVSDTQDKHTSVIDRLARIETKQDQLLQVIITKRRKD